MNKKLRTLGIFSLLAIPAVFSISKAVDTQDEVTVTAQEDINLTTEVLEQDEVQDNVAPKAKAVNKSMDNVVVIAKSVDDMKHNKNLKENDIVETICYSKEHDGGRARYLIKHSNKKSDDGSIHKLDNGLTAELIVENNSIDIRQFGAQVGLYADVKANTKAIQNAINFAKDDKCIVFPAGWIITDTLDLGSGSNITLKGVSNNMGSYINKKNGDTFSKILYVRSKQDKPLFTQERCMMIFENLGFYGSTTIDGVTYGSNKSILLKGDVVDKSIDYKGKVFANNCEFAGWGTVFGGASIKYDSKGNPTLKYVKSTRKQGSYLQTCVLATNCRFSNNEIALSQLVDGRILGCSFNKNKYAIVFGPKSGFTTVANSRIEWNAYNGTYIDSAHDVSLNNNEYDRNGRAGIYAINCEGLNITNNYLRRSGADETLATNDIVNNTHLYVKGTSNGNISNNVTAVKYNYDSKIDENNSNGKKGLNRPSNVSHFEDNNNLIVANNCLNGGNNKENSLNTLNNNTNFIFSSNLTKK